MASLTQDNVRVQVLIMEDTARGRFQDAVYFSPTEFDALDESALAALKQKRADDWVASVEAASQIERPEPTVEELEAEKAELVARVAEIDEKIAEK